MKDVIVVSYATHRAGLLDEYEAQLAAAGIDFHLETVELVEGINSVTARWKFEFMRRMCERFIDYQRIVFTDAWDVLFFGRKEDLSIPPHLLISGERNCWPEDGIAEAIQSPSPWRYCNAGLVCGSPLMIRDWLLWNSSVGDPGGLEQQWFNRRIVDRASPVFVDAMTRHFYTVSADKEDCSLRSISGRPWNSRYNTSPQFFHFSGQCPTEPFRRMLETGEPLCASV